MARGDAGGAGVAFPLLVRTAEAAFAEVPAA